MKTKLFSILVIILLSGSATFAQELRPGIVGGFNLQNINGKDLTGDRLENNLIFGYHFGVNVLMPVSLEIFLQPGLLFTSKGALDKENSPDLKYRINYLELPLNIVYRGQFGNDFVLVGFGPYLAMALGGNVMVGDEERKIDFRNKVSLSDPLTSPYLRRFDAGANIFAGYELGNGLYFTLNAQLGLVKINPEYEILDDDSTWKNTGYGVSVGFRF
jgi:hypothetical protein